MKKLSVCLGVLVLFFAAGFLSADDAPFPPDRWTIEPDGSIQWNVEADRLPHQDHIEMSGERVSTILRYEVTEQGSFSIDRSLVWPMLRRIPNNTHASLMHHFAPDTAAALLAGGKPLGKEKVETLKLNGFLTVVSVFERDGAPAFRLERKFFPSRYLPMTCERYRLTNLTGKEVTVTVPEYRDCQETDPAQGVSGSYTMIGAISGAGDRTLKPNEQLEFGVSFQAFSPAKGESELTPDFETEEANRQALIDELWGNLVFESPNPVLNRMFAFAKIRVSESIYRTARGLMHGPGGESYYAAIWANDQAEYANPFFPFLGYQTGNESALNSYVHFARFMNMDYKPIPSSIIAEGFDIWDGAGDRGDAAMIAHGAARYVLVRGDEKEARRLWPLIEWCLEYCRLNLNEQGVVKSDHDELEGRFPAGDANLCTSTLYYDALLSAASLVRELGLPAEQAETYQREAAELRKNIDAFFGAEVEGFQTYRYYEGNDLLRSWICMPLVVGITERTDETVKALFSEKLWTVNGLLTQSGTSTYWDRSTLYALRGAYIAGAVDKASEYLNRYSRVRLLGEHVPYAVEAWPEGAQRHLSAESGLYCRIFTEGIFGIRPTGFRSFRTTPRLTDGWNEMSLKNIRGFGTVPFDVAVERTGEETLRVTVSQNGNSASAEGKVFDVTVGGDKPAVTPVSAE